MAGRIRISAGLLLNVLFVVGAFAQQSVPALVQVSGATGASQAALDANQRKVAETYGKLPLSFEANQGQTDRRVRFLSRGSGYSVFLAPTETVLTLREPSQRTAVLRMKLLDANATPVGTGLEEVSGKSNYFIGNDPKLWRTNIPNYGKVRFAGVYPGVDLVYYGNQRQLEYDFIVAPGANPSAIRLGFAGAERLEIDAQGELALHTHAGEVRWHKPVVYQEIDGVRQIVDGRYVRKGNNAVGFVLASYDTQHALIIDPVLVYSTYLGGSGEDGGGGIAVDASGNAYVTGFTTSVNFPITAGALHNTSAGAYDTFVAKLNPAGSALVYSTYLGGSGNDVARAIAVDSSGSAYVFGDTASTNFPTLNPFQPTYGGGPTDVFVTKLNAAGNALAYSTYLGGSRTEFSRGIALDSSGNAYLTGRTDSTNYPTTAGAFQTTLSTLAGVSFVTKLNAAGNAVSYSTYLGGSGGEDSFSVAVDSSGNAYVIGLTISTNFPTTAGSFQPAFGGGYDVFVTKLNSSGTGLVYSTYLGGSGTDQGFGIAVDSAGNAYVTGLTNSTNFPTANPLQAALGGGNDAFVTKLNAAGSALVFSTYLGGSGNDQGLGIAVDSAGNVYLKGDTGSSNFPTASPFQAALGGGTDVFVTKLNSTGSALVYSSYLGGSGTDMGHGLVSAIALDSAGNVYVTGDTTSTNFLTVNPIQVVYGGGPSDAFVAKIGQVVNAQPPTITKVFGDDSIPLGSDTSLTFTLNNPNLTTALSGVSFTDNLPAGLIVGTPNGLTGSCGGTVSATPDSSSISLSSGMLAANSGCMFSVTVTGQMVGSWLNTTEAVSSTESGDGDTASANITVQPPPPNCHGQITSQLAQQYGGLRAAAEALGFQSVKALQAAIKAFCWE